jgi:hypothetical protein
MYREPPGGPPTSRDAGDVGHLVVAADEKDELLAVGVAEDPEEVDVSPSGCPT